MEFSVKLIFAVYAQFFVALKQNQKILTRVNSYKELNTSRSEILDPGFRLYEPEKARIVSSLNVQIQLPSELNLRINMQR
jgi:hypothetical protein